MDVSVKKFKILKHGYFTHIFRAAQKFGTVSAVSRWTPEISVNTSVSDQMCNMVTLNGNMVYFPFCFKIMALKTL